MLSSDKAYDLEIWVKNQYQNRLPFASLDIQFSYYNNDVSIITYGMGVHWAIEVLNQNKNINADLVDLRSLVPLDEETIINSVKKTGKVIILHEDCMIGGFGADIAFLINENCFEFLDAPVARASSLNTPVPFSPALENQFLPKKRFEDKLFQLLAY